jgi:hypothetical protein
MLLASNKEQHKERTKTERHNRKTTYIEKDSREEQRPSGLTRSTPLTRPFRIILKNPNAEIPKRNFSLLSNPLVLSKRIV